MREEREIQLSREKFPPPKSLREVIAILEESVVLICWIDNLFPGNAFVGELYYKIYDLKRELEKKC